MGISREFHAPVAFCPLKVYTRNTHRIGSWMSRTARLHMVAKRKIPISTEN
jgi:hypothetical protein